MYQLIKPGYNKHGEKDKKKGIEAQFNDNY